MRQVVRITENELKRIVNESVKKILKEDHQNLPIQSIIDYLNQELNYLTVSYNLKNDELTISSKEYMGLGDASPANSLSSFFDTIAKEFRIIEKYTMGTIGSEIDGTNYDKETKTVQNMTLQDPGMSGTITMDETGGLKVLFKAKGHSNVYFWGGKMNPYDETDYLIAKHLKPNANMDWYDQDEYDQESAVDKRDPKKMIKNKWDKMWQNQLDRDKYIRQANSRPLHRKGSANRDLMKMDK